MCFFFFFWWITAVGELQTRGNYIWLPVMTCLVLIVFDVFLFLLLQVQITHSQFNVERVTLMCRWLSPIYEGEANVYGAGLIVKAGQMGRWSVISRRWTSQLMRLSDEEGILAVATSSYAIVKMLFFSRNLLFLPAPPILMAIPESPSSADLAGRLLPPPAEPPLLMLPVSSASSCEVPRWNSPRPPPPTKPVRAPASKKHTRFSRSELWQTNPADNLARTKNLAEGSCGDPGDSWHLKEVLRQCDPAPRRSQSPQGWDCAHGRRSCDRSWPVKRRRSVAFRPGIAFPQRAPPPEYSGLRARYCSATQLLLRHHLWSVITVN